MFTDSNKTAYRLVLDKKEKKHVASMTFTVVNLDIYRGVCFFVLHTFEDTWHEDMETSLCKISSVVSVATSFLLFKKRLKCITAGMADEEVNFAPICLVELYDNVHDLQKAEEK